MSVDGFDTWTVYTDDNTTGILNGLGFVGKPGIGDDPIRQLSIIFSRCLRTERSGFIVSHQGVHPGVFLKTITQCICT
jgi:hypothetical protein